jgi:hypothetical protein
MAKIKHSFNRRGKRSLMDGGFGARAIPLMVRPVDLTSDSSLNE